MLRYLALGAMLACSHHVDRRATTWRDDLHELATELPNRHKQAFAHVSEPDWRAAVADLDRKISTFDDAHAIAGLARLVAAIGDPHTTIGAQGHAGFYRLNLIWFDDGIFVGGADPEQAWAIGRKLVGIDAHSIDDAIAALTPLVSHANAAGLHAELPYALVDAGLLAGVDLAASDRATFQLAAADGTVRAALLHPVVFGPPQLAPPDPLPLHLQGPNTRYWNKYVETDRLLYFAYNACADDPRIESFAQFAAETLAFVDQHPVDRFVIDLRSNGGGNSSVLEPLLEGIEQRHALDGRVFAIIGMHTFSSAVMNVMDLKRRLRARLVGGPTAHGGSHFGEVAQFELSHSKLPVKYSTKLFSNPDFPGDAIEPDLPVTVKAADWFSGRDPSLEAILAAPVPK